MITYDIAAGSAESIVREMSDLDNDVGAIVIVVNIKTGDFHCAYNTPSRAVTRSTLMSVERAIADQFPRAL